jgi:hypothetical protein
VRHDCRSGARSDFGKLCAVEQRPHGWHGHVAPGAIVIARSGRPLGSVLSEGRRFELSISRIKTGYRLLIVDWADESSVESDHPTLDAAMQNAASVLHDDALNWETRMPPGEDGA